jgi:lipopolysaccharide/colanic/teichoic acid biosynthesis glycosyltransferase
MKRNYLPAVLPRLSVPPGITGWAQILGSRNFSTREGYQLDLWYVAHRTFWLDLLIVVWTPLYIVLGFSLSAGLRERCLKEMGNVGPLFAGETGGLVP